MCSFGTYVFIWFICVHLVHQKNLATLFFTSKGEQTLCCCCYCRHFIVSAVSLLIAAKVGQSSRFVLLDRNFPMSQKARLTCLPFRLCPRFSAFAFLQKNFPPSFRSRAADPGIKDRSLNLSDMPWRAGVLVISSSPLKQKIVGSNPDDLKY
jgi:hypothetical protein